MHNINFFQLNGRRLPLELKLLLQIQNIPGIIRLVDFYERDDSFIYVQESPFPYTELDDIINKKGMLVEPLAQHFFLQVVETVIACHSQGVIHGGIRETNLLVDLHTMDLKLIHFQYGKFIDVKKGNASLNNMRFIGKSNF